MTPAELYTELSSAGFTLAIGPSGRLVVSPASRLTPGLKMALSKHREALQAIVSAIESVRGVFPGAQVVAVRPAQPERCRLCGGTRYWTGSPGHRACMTCHPPAPGVVVREVSDA